MNLRSIIGATELALAWAWPANAADLLGTQYKNDPSGAPYGVALEKGFFKEHGIDITGIISGAGGGNSGATPWQAIWAMATSPRPRSSPPPNRGRTSRS